MTILLKKRMALFFTLTLLWFALAGKVDMRQTLTGSLSAIFSIILYEWLLSHARIKPLAPMPKIRWLKLLPLIVISIIKSAWHHIFRIISGNEDIIFIQIALDYEHPYVTMLIANIITLTPGAVSVEVDKNLLKILCYAPRNQEEHLEIYQFIEDLQSAFVR